MDIFSMDIVIYAACVHKLFIWDIGAWSYFYYMKRETDNLLAPVKD